jgi:hypothetical protein
VPGEITEAFRRDKKKKKEKREKMQDANPASCEGARIDPAISTLSYVSSEQLARNDHSDELRREFNS